MKFVKIKSQGVRSSRENSQVAFKQLSGRSPFRFKGDAVLKQLICLVFIAANC